MSNLERPTVKRVRQALLAAGLEDRVVELNETARSANDAAEALGCELGAIVKSLVFAIGNRFVMALVAGDHDCVENNLGKALNMQGKVRRPPASEVKGITGFSIGGVAPLGLTHPLPMIIDGSLKRFDTIFAAAGHPHCVFSADFSELSRATGALVSYGIARPQDGISGYKPVFKRSRTFSER